MTFYLILAAIFVVDAAAIYFLVIRRGFKNAQRNNSHRKRETQLKFMANV